MTLIPLKNYQLTVLAIRKDICMFKQYYRFYYSFFINVTCLANKKCQSLITLFLVRIVTTENCIFFQIYEEGNDLYSAHRPQTCNLKNQHFMHLTEIETLLDLEIYTTW